MNLTQSVLKSLADQENRETKDAFAKAWSAEDPNPLVMMSAFVGAKGGTWTQEMLSAAIAGTVKLSKYCAKLAVANLIQIPSPWHQN